MARPRTDALDPCPLDESRLGGLLRDLGTLVDAAQYAVAELQGGTDRMPRPVADPRANRAVTALRHALQEVIRT